ncbi:hypothetical protein PV646_10385 [Streptomyces sp. ID05-26A]|nr:hypothetical protein [Streptomyces sp. ID05-26A]
MITGAVLASAELSTVGHGGNQHLIDVRTGAHLGTFDAHTEDAYA